MKKIFLVDDDADDQVFFIEALSNIKNTSLFWVANNGKDALDKLMHSDFIPDIIFLDVNMLLMNGTECLRAIKRFPRTEHIPVIMLSTAVDHSNANRIDPGNYIIRVYIIFLWLWISGLWLSFYHEH